MVALCEEENRKTVNDKFNLNLQQLLNTFKSEEFVRNQRLMEQVNFSDPDSLKKLYVYALNTELAYILEANEVGKNHHSGKFDPSMMQYADPKKLKKKT